MRHRRSDYRRNDEECPQHLGAEGAWERSMHGLSSATSHARCAQPIMLAPRQPGPPACGLRAPTCKASLSRLSRIQILLGGKISVRQTSARLLLGVGGTWREGIRVYSLPAVHPLSPTGNSGGMARNRGRRRKRRRREERGQFLGQNLIRRAVFFPLSLRSPTPTPTPTPLIIYTSGFHLNRWNGDTPPRGC